LSWIELACGIGMVLFCCLSVCYARAIIRTLGIGKQQGAYYFSLRKENERGISFREGDNRGKGEGVTGYDSKATIVRRASTLRMVREP